MPDPVSSILNLGPATEAAFARAGIHSADEIRDMGADAAYLRLIEAGTQPHFIGYYVLVMGLQGLNVLRWFFRIFYGPAPMFADPRERMELLPRERVALLMVLGLLFVGGLVPSALPVLGEALP